MKRRESESNSFRAAFIVSINCSSKFSTGAVYGTYKIKLR